MQLRNAVFLVLIMVLFFNPNTVFAEHDPHRIALRYARLDYRVDEMPLDFRSVPIHSDDGYARLENWGPVENEKYDRDHWLSIDYAYLWQLNDRWSCGMGLVWILDFWEDFGKESRRNYTNNPGTDRRGYGAALTFVSTGVRGLLEIEGGETDTGSLLNFTPKFIVEYKLGNGFNFGLSASYHRFVALRGWDRWNSFEIDDKETLAHIYPITLDLTFKFINVGISYNICDLTDFGEKAKTEIGEISYTFGFQWAF